MLADDRPVARKEHRCDICWGRVPAGAAYVRQRNICDGEPYVFKAHTLCWVVSCRMHRELGLFDDEWPDEDEVRAEVLRCFDWLGIAASREATGA